MTAQEYEKKYIDLCEDLCQCADDHTQEKVKRHNAAMGQIQALAAKLSEDPAVAKEVFGALLKHENIRVRASAAGQCLKYGLMTRDAEKALKAICKSSDKISAFGAEMTLRVWRGKVPGKTL